MKKYLKLFCILSAVIMIVFAFSACKKTQEEKLLEMEEAERAEELGRLSDEAMEAKNSYKITMNGRMETLYEGEKMINISKMVVSYLKADTDAFVYQEKQESNITYDGEETENVTIEGYQNGYMYIDSQGEDGNSRFKSSLTKDEYINHMKSMETENEAKLDKTGCNNLTAVRNDDGTWTATFAGFTESNLKALMKDLQNPEAYFDDDYKITDVMISLTLENDFGLKTIILEFVFNKKENDNSASQLSVASEETDPNMPVFTAEYTVEYGDNLAVAEEIDLSSAKYKEIDDLRNFYIIEKELDEIKNSKDAKAELTINQVVSLLTSKETVNEVDKIDYGIVDGKLEYDIEATTDDEYYRIVYKNGKQDVLDENGETDSSEAMQEIEARVFLESLLDQASYGIDVIKNMEKVSDGEYKFTLKPNVTAYEAIADAYSGSISSNTAYLIIKMMDGKITSYTYELTVKIYIPVFSANMVITQENECTYEY